VWPPAWSSGPTPAASAGSSPQTLERYGVPEELLTDYGKVFTGRLGPHPGEVLFDRICREQGITHRLTGVRCPTTTGKIERFHKTPRAELVQACWELGARPGLARLRLRAWAHMLGFGGHFASKSCRYSITLGALRRARVAYAIRRRRGGAVPLDAWGRQEDDDQTAVAIATWRRYLGSGYLSTGEAWLAASAAARAREQRRIAREELRTMTAA
jgi:hypothetical protein